MPGTRRDVLDDRAAGAALLGRRLATAREHAGLTQVQAATALGVPQSVIGKLELGLRQLRFVEGLRLAALYQISPGELAPDATSPRASLQPT